LQQDTVRRSFVGLGPVVVAALAYRRWAEDAAGSAAGEPVGP
jgi:hypothetical protein